MHLANYGLDAWRLRRPVLVRPEPSNNTTSHHTGVRDHAFRPRQWRPLREDIDEELLRDLR